MAGNIASQQRQDATASRMNNMSTSSSTSSSLPSTSVLDPSIVGHHSSMPSNFTTIKEDFLPPSNKKQKQNHDSMNTEEIPSTSNTTLTKPTSPTFPNLRQLPNEALLVIFQSLYDIRRSVLLPCLLVCKSWNKLITDEKKFWSYLRLDFHAFPEDAVWYTRSILHRCVQTHTFPTPRNVETATSQNGDGKSDSNDIDHSSSRNSSSSQHPGNETNGSSKAVISSQLVERERSPPLPARTPSPQSRKLVIQKPYFISAIDPSRFTASLSTFVFIFRDPNDIAKQKGLEVFVDHYFPCLNQIMKLLYRHLYDTDDMTVYIEGMRDCHLLLMRGTLEPRLCTIETHMNPNSMQYGQQEEGQNGGSQTQIQTSQQVQKANEDDDGQYHGLGDARDSQATLRRASDTSSADIPIEQQSRICNSKLVHYELPHILGIPLAINSLAWFSSAEKLTLMGAKPGLRNIVTEPDRPRIPTVLAKVQRARESRREVDLKQLGLNEMEISFEQERYEAAQKTYHEKLAAYKAYRAQYNLDWEWFHQPAVPVPGLSAPHKFKADLCIFHALGTLRLHGCTIASSLVLPKNGFPKLHTLSIIKSIWGRGFWDFLRCAPRLEALDISELHAPWEIDHGADACVLDEKFASELEKPESPHDIAGSDATLIGQHSEEEEEDNTGGDNETRAYPAAASNKSSESKQQQRWQSKVPNYILDNTVSVWLGDDIDVIVDFDGDDAEDVLGDGFELDETELVNEIEDNQMIWKQEQENTAYDYPEDLCYPTRIDSGASWHIVTKPNCEGHWKETAGYRYHHRVWTHGKDKPLLEDDFDSAYTWEQLQRKRQVFRLKQDARLSLISNDYIKKLQAIHEENVPQVEDENLKPIVLPLLHSFHFTGGTFEHIWAPTMGYNVLDDIRVTTHPPIYMPNVRSISLEGDFGLAGTRMCQPLPEFYAASLSLNESEVLPTCGHSEMPTTEYIDMLKTFLRGKKPLKNEPTDEELFLHMTDAELMLYGDDPSMIHLYRQKWRVQEGLMDERGARDENNILAMFIGATRPCPLPHSAAALVASASHLLQLDLSHSNIDSATFQAIIERAPKLRGLGLAGTQDIDNRDLYNLAEYCPLLENIDITKARRMTPKGVAVLFDKIRERSHGMVRLKRIRVSDPHFLHWRETISPARQAECNYYDYLQFVGVVIDDEAERWRKAIQSDKPHPKKHGKMPLMYYTII